MRAVIRSFFIVVLLGFFTDASTQLPPKIVADKHLIHTEQILETAPTPHARSREL